MCSCINKVVLVVVNVLFAILGAAVLGVSLWVIFSQDSMITVVRIATSAAKVDDATVNNYMSSPSMLSAAAWVLVGFGALSLLVGVCGCVGACMESVCLLVTYSVLVSLILICEIGGAIAVAVFKAQIANGLKPKLTSLELQHFLPIEQAISNKNSSGVITGLVNYMQVSFICCGINNASDITVNTSAWSRAGPMFRNQSQTVPVTCCQMNNRGELLSKQDWANVQKYLKDINCPITGANSIVGGCYDQIDNTIAKFTWPLIIGGIVIGLSELLCVVMACALVQKVRNEGGHDV